MNLGAGFQIGRSGLAAAQNIMSIAGNNMSNAATPGYRRQRLGMVPLSGVSMIGVGTPGQGVRVSGLMRAVDMALLARLRHARADEAGLATSNLRLGTVEDLLASAGEGGVGGAVETFLRTWSDLAESPDDPAMRGVIVQHGVGLAGQIQTLRHQLVLERDEIDRSLQDGVNRANELLTSIESLTNQIREAESTGGAAPALRDTRDAVIDELSTLLDLVVVDRPDGSLDLLVGSTPIMLSGDSLGITIGQLPTGTSLLTVEDHAPLLAGGSLGALLGRRQDGVQAMIVRLDQFGRELINAVNRIHIEGHGLTGRQSLTSFIGVDDPAAPIATLPGLAAPVTAGLIQIQVGQVGSENPVVIQIAVDPTTDSLADVAAAIDAAGTVPTAFVDASGHLVIEVPPGWEVSVLEDEPGLFTAIQLGGFFTGFGASDIAVAQELVDDPQLLSAAHGEDASAVAVAMAGLVDAVIPAFDTTLGNWWRIGESELAARVRSTADGVEASTMVRLGLESQEQAISGVSVDEEAMNLIVAQTQYEAAARYVSALQQSIDALLAMITR